MQKIYLELEESGDRYMDKEKIAQYRRFYRAQLLDDTIPFWLNSDLLDRQYGGYITSVDRAGKSYNTDKSVWFQGRCLWTFSALCTRFGVRSEWLEAAKLGKTFLENYCVDTDGRMFFTVTRDGRPLRKRRYMYSESFFVMGMAEYAFATGDRDALNKAEICFERMLQIYHNPTSDPYFVTPKSFAATRAERTLALPMVLVSCAQVLRRCDAEKAAYYTNIAGSVIGDIIKYHVKNEWHCVLENVLLDGTYIDNPAGRTINPGHSIENAWFMMCQAVYTNDKELLDICLNILNWSLKRGWDTEFGGCYYFVDLNNRPCEQLEWDMKLWWVHNEILIATLMAYCVTKDETYIHWFEKVHEYAFGHFHDKDQGEWYGYLHRDGTVSHTQKGSMWKGPFHLPRCLMLVDSLFDLLEAHKPIVPIL